MTEYDEELWFWNWLKKCPLKPGWDEAPEMEHGVARIRNNVDLLDALKIAQKARPGTGKSDVNAFILPVTLQCWMLDDAIEEIERLRKISQL